MFIIQYKNYFYIFIQKFVIFFEQHTNLIEVKSMISKITISHKFSNGSTNNLLKTLYITFYSKNITNQKNKITRGMFGLNSLRNGYKWPYMCRFVLN